MHRLAALAYHLLQASHTPVPDDTMERLRERYHVAATFHLLYAATLGELLRDFRAVGLVPIVLKGLPLAERVYPDPLARAMLDIDLLVRRDGLPAAQRVLEARGFVPWLDPADPPAAFQEKIHGELTYSHDDTPWLNVDLHTELIMVETFRPALRFPVEDVWRRARATAVAAEAGLVLDDEDTLLYLCLHWAVGHQFGKLASSVDLALWIARLRNLDWDAVVERACAARMRRAVFASLRLAEALWGPLPVPWNAVERLRPTRWPFLLNHVSPDASLSVVGRRQDRARHLVYLRLADHLPASGRVLLCLLWPGRRWLVLRYGLKRTWQVVLWSLWHPFRLAGALAGALQAGRRQRTED